MRVFPALFSLLSCSLFAVAQPAPRVYTAADYARAEQFMPYNTNPLVLHTVADPKWLPDGRVWYRDTGAQGTSFVLVDPARGTKGTAFDQVKLATALSVLNPGRPAVDANHLPVREFALEGERTVTVTVGGRKLSCDLSGAGVCIPAANQTAAGGGRRRRGGSGGVEPSPDGTRAAFIRDWNLWVREVATGKETQLTTDGVKDYGYATDNAGWQHSDNPILVWSPDSKRIATFQQDQRKTGEMYLTNVTYGHPTLTTLKYPLVGDKDVTMIERVIIDVEHGKVVRLKMPPDQHRSTLVRRHHRAAGGAAGMMCNGPPIRRCWHSCRPRGTTNRSGCASPTPVPATCAR